jgi:hypothetical protein
MVLYRNPSFNLFCTGSVRFLPSDEYNHGDGNAANVDDDDADDDDEDDDDDDDDDECGYLHEVVETRHELEMNGN